MKVFMLYKMELGKETFFPVFQGHIKLETFDYPSGIPVLTAGF